MRKPYRRLILVLAAMALVTGGCQKKGSAVETNASTEAAVTESTTAREPVSEETWSWLVQTYKLLEANYETGQKLVEDGLATQTEDPEEVVAEQSACWITANSAEKKICWKRMGRTCSMTW